MHHLVIKNSFSIVKAVLADEYPFFEGKDIRRLIIEFLSTDDYMSFALTNKHFMRTLKNIWWSFPPTSYIVQSVQLIQWAFNYGYKLKKYTYKIAAKGGHLEVLKWLKLIGCPFNEKTLDSSFRLATKEGHVDVMLWLLIQKLSF